MEKLKKYSFIEKTITYLYIIPFYYIAMYIDINYRHWKQYMMFLVFILLSCFLLGRRKKWKTVITGSMLTTFISTICIYVFHYSELHKWGIYFKCSPVWLLPFYTMFYTMVIELVIIAILFHIGNNVV